MTPSALLWFIDLCTHYAPAPDEAQKLGHDLQKQLNSKNDRIQISRAFRRRSVSMSKIRAWLTGSALNEAVRAKGCSETSSAHATAVAAIDAILNGEAPSTAWGMDKTRGIDTGFSATLDAAALVGYLTMISASDWLPETLYTNSEELSGEYLLLAYCLDRRTYCSGHLFSQAAALRIASTLFGVNEDNVRKYTGIDPISEQSEAALAIFALSQRGLLTRANSHFDVKDLLEVATKKM